MNAQDTTTGSAQMRQQDDGLTFAVCIHCGRRWTYRREDIEAAFLPQLEAAAKDAGWTLLPTGWLCPDHRAHTDAPASGPGPSRSSGPRPSGAGLKPATPRPH